MPQAALIVLVLIVGAPILFIDWFVGLSITEQIPVAIGVTAVVALVGHLVWKAWQERERERKEYHQALLDFRWREDMSPIEFERCCADYLGLRVRLESAHERAIRRVSSMTDAA